MLFLATKEVSWSHPQDGPEPLHPPAHFLSQDPPCTKGRVSPTALLLELQLPVTSRLLDSASWIIDPQLTNFPISKALKDKSI
jgi:hypothetical protein